MVFGMFFLLGSVLYLVHYIYKKGHYFSREWLRKNRTPEQIYIERDVKLIGEISYEIPSTRRELMSGADTERNNI